MTIIAQKDDMVTCENGHPLFEIVNKIEKDADRTIRARDFRSVRKDLQSPEPGEPLGRCPECGASYWRHKGLGYYQFHFEDGWRP